MRRGLVNAGGSVADAARFKPNYLFIHGQMFASPSNTRGKIHVRESRSRGSVRGALGHERPYRGINAVAVRR